MKDPVSEVKRKLGPALSRNNRGHVIVHRCERDGCSVLLDENFPPHRALVDVEHPDLELPEESSRCDYLFIAGKHNDCWVVPIELTSGGKKPSVVKKQLDAGAELANRTLHQSTKVKFLPVLANNGIRKSDRDRMKNLKIKFRGQLEILRLLRCGDPLSKALKQK